MSVCLLSMWVPEESRNGKRTSRSWGWKSRWMSHLTWRCGPPEGQQALLSHLSSPHNGVLVIHRKNRIPLLTGKQADLEMTLSY